MSIDIRLKHSAVNGKAPQPSDLSDGELALNINDANPAIYLKDSAGAVRRMDAGVAYTKTETDTALALKADLASPALTGTPTAPTAAAGTNTTQVATTAFVKAAAVWTRTGTTLSPATAGDDVDLGTGDLSAAAGTFSGLAKSAGLESSGDVLVGGTLPASPNITLDANGGVSSNATTFNPGTADWTKAAFVATGGYGGGLALIDGGAGYSLRAESSGTNFYIQYHSSLASGGFGGVFIASGAGSWSSVSDEREKTNLQPISNALEKIKVLRTVIGSYKTNPEQKHPFLIAQDVAKVLPEAVCVSNPNALETDQRLGMSYTDVIPLLTAALQEAIGRIEILEAEVQALKAS